MARAELAAEGWRGRWRWGKLSGVWRGIGERRLLRVREVGSFSVVESGAAVAIAAVLEVVGRADEIAAL